MPRKTCMHAGCVQAGSAQLAVVVDLQLLLTARRGVRNVELHAQRTRVG